jgi:hypothetical protein
MRGARNAGAQDGYLIAIPGGTDAGYWRAPGAVQAGGLGTMAP